MFESQLSKEIAFIISPELNISMNNDGKVGVRMENVWVPILRLW